MFPAIPSIAKSGNLTDRGIDRIDRAESAEVGLAEREPSRDDSQDREEGSESPVRILSTESSVGTLLDVVA